MRPPRPASRPDGLWDAMESVYVSLGAAAPSGLLLKYDPASRQTTALAAGLWFGNGVALSAGEEFVAVADSIRARVLRCGARRRRRGADRARRRRAACCLTPRPP
jgi:sugar lactone lactonase YvrE